MTGVMTIGLERTFRPRPVAGPRDHTYMTKDVDLHRLRPEVRDRLIRQRQERARQRQAGR